MVSGAIEEVGKALPRTLCPLPSTFVSGSVVLISSQYKYGNATQGEPIASCRDLCMFVSPRGGQSHPCSKMLRKEMVQDALIRSQLNNTMPRVRSGCISGF